MSVSAQNYPTSVPAQRSETGRTIALDDLLSVDEPGLRRLYRSAEVPALDEISGDLSGRMLATTVLKEPVASLARAWAGSRAFPWRGKSFCPLGDGRGQGMNRVLTDRIRLFRFETSIAKSRAGDFDAVHLDYDLPDNPFFIRKIQDEIRKIGDRLYLGQAYLALPKGPHLVLYFGLAG